MTHAHGRRFGAGVAVCADGRCEYESGVGCARLHRGDDVLRAAHVDRESALAVALAVGRQQRR